MVVELHQGNVDRLAAVRHPAYAEAEPVAQASFSGEMRPYSGVCGATHAVVEAGALLVLQLERDGPSSHPAPKHGAGRSLADGLGVRENKLAHGEIRRYSNFAKKRFVGQLQLLDPSVALSQELAAHVVVGEYHLDAFFGHLAELGL